MHFSVSPLEKTGAQIQVARVGFTPKADTGYVTTRGGYRHTIAQVLEASDKTDPFETLIIKRPREKWPLLWGCVFNPLATAGLQGIKIDVCEPVQFQLGF
jgi:hypothetical protein